MQGPEIRKNKLSRFTRHIPFSAFNFEDGSPLSSSKVWVVMGVISLLLIFGGQAFGRFGLLVGFLLALSVNSFVFFYADIRIAKLFPGRELEGQDAWGILRQVKRISRLLSIQPPMIMLIESETPLAFSAGLLPSRSTIYLSRELLNRLSEEEVAIVLAYELHRLKTHQTASATAASALVGFLTHTARVLDSALLFRWFFSLFESVRERRATLLRNGGIQTGPITLLIAPLVALIVRFSISRKVLFASDRAAGELTANGPATVARTLWKLDSYAKTRPFPVDLAEAHLFTVSPLTRYPMWKFASAQPPIEARLKALTGYEPL